MRKRARLVGADYRTPAQRFDGFKLSYDNVFLAHSLHAHSHYYGYDCGKSFRYGGDGYCNRCHEVFKYTVVAHEKPHNENKRGYGKHKAGYEFAQLIQAFFKRSTRRLGFFQHCGDFAHFRAHAHRRYYCCRVAANHVSGIEQGVFHGAQRNLVAADCLRVLFDAYAFAGKGGLVAF